MAKLWVVCGAGRGVGKTRVALGLTALLPDAHYAKHGHGEPQPDKPGALLHDLPQVERFLGKHAHHRHAVIESNALAAEGRGDLIVFVEGEPRGMPRRPDADQLRERAHIVLDHGQPIAAWRRHLGRLLGAGGATSAVLQLLLEQAWHLPMPPIRPGTKLWLSLPGDHGMGKGLVTLLAEIDAQGTLRGASQATGISYRHAWDLIRAAEGHLAAPLVISQPGGAGGGGTSLTAVGLRLVRCWPS